MADKFICALCKSEFDKGWSDDQAKTEFANNFPCDKLEDSALICDDCYKLMGFGSC